MKNKKIKAILSSISFTTLNYTLLKEITKFKLTDEDTPIQGTKLSRNTQLERIKNQKMINEINEIISKIKTSKPKQMIEGANECLGPDLPPLPYCGDLLRIFEQIDQIGMNIPDEKVEQESDDVSVTELINYRLENQV